jgi:hypothetical protein
MVGFYRGIVGGIGTYLISFNTEFIILCSACRTARSSPFASHSHCASAGWEQIAQSGSMILTGFLDLECLINMISGRRYGIKNIKNYKRRFELVRRRFQKEGEVGREQNEIKRGLGKRGVLCMIDRRTHDKSWNER